MLKLISSKSKLRQRSRFNVYGTVLVMAMGINSCAPIRGYPDGFEDEDSAVVSLASLAAQLKVSYYNQPGEVSSRTAIRNRIIFAELQASEIKFTEFQMNLWSENNYFTTGSDLLVLALNGLGATTGNAVTKAALSAASGGIVGAQGVINKDIYYQRTLPAIMAQISADRDKIKARILGNIKIKDDSQYSLPEAEIDLQSLRRASGIVDAVQNITEKTTTDKLLSAAQVEEARQGAFSKAITSQRLSAWIGYGIDPITGKAYTPNAANLKALQNWVDRNAPGLPVAQLFTENKSVQMEKIREQAINELHVP